MQSSQNYPCRHFGTCGGCTLQGVADVDYRAGKMARVTEALRARGIDPDSLTIDGPHVSPPGARRRAVMAAYRGHDKFVIGFNEPRSNKIVDLQECPVLHPRLAALIPGLRDCIASILTAGQGMDVAMTESGRAVDIVLRPWVRGKNPPLPQGFMLERLSALAEAEDIARLSWQIRADDPSDVMPVAWRKPFTVDFSGTIVSPPPGAFMQATAEGEAALCAFVLDHLPQKKLNILDLFAGCGTFTFTLAARKGYKVHAVEGYRPALEALQKAMPGRPVSAECRDLAEEPFLPRELKDYDVVLLDPPRIGAVEQVKALARMDAKSNLKTVIYISCHADSFARDASILQQAGFTIGPVRVVDQFLWSPHVELAAVLRR